MIKRLSVSGFRSIERVRVDLAPITVFYGPTSGGKSSLFYALVAFRNFILNPSQALDGIFTLGFQTLGSFRDCVFDHDDSKAIDIGIDYETDLGSGTFGATLNKASAELRLSVPGLDMNTGTVPVPYSLSPAKTFTLADDGVDFNVSWNGVSSTVAPAANPTTESQARGAEIARSLNASHEALRRVDIAPHRRGFFKPFYSSASATQALVPTSEDDVGSIIINDAYMQGRLSAYLEPVFGKDFRIQTQQGTVVNYFQTTDKGTRVPGLLVNDGFGVNQAVYILAKLLRVDVDTLMLEEPEIHLHPTVMRRFAKELCTLVKEEHKQLALTTHSEHFLVSLLNCVRDGLLQTDDLRCYYVAREKKATIFSEQKVHSNGQVEGGLRSFLEAETEDLRSFLSVKS